MSPRPVLYLSGETIRRLPVSPGRLRAALAEAFRLRAADEPRVEPKRPIPLGPGHFFQTMVAASGSLGYAAVKWVGVAAANAGHGLATVQATLILSDLATGAPVAILDGESVTVLRTAALSTLAASFLARPDARSIGFVGCGEQARGHLDAFVDLMPGLATAVCLSRDLATAERFAAGAAERRLAARATTDPAAILGCDIVVTSVRAGPDLSPFLDAGALRPGAFVTAVDLGASWRPDTLAAFDLAATDDRRSTDDPSTRSRIPYPGRFDADLAELCSRAVSVRASPDRRSLFVFPGNALADLAAAIVFVEAARETGAGFALPE